MIYTIGRSYNSGTIKQLYYKIGRPIQIAQFPGIIVVHSAYGKIGRPMLLYI